MSPPAATPAHRTAVPGRSPFRKSGPRPWLALVATVAITFAAASIGILSLGGRADAARATMLDLERMQSAVATATADTRVWLNEHFCNSADQRHFVSDPGVRSSIGQVGGMLGKGEAQQLNGAVARLGGAMDQECRLTDVGRLNDARDVDNSLTVPALSALGAVLVRLQNEGGRRAARLSRIENLGSTATMTILAFLVCVLVARFDRDRRRHQGLSNKVAAEARFRSLLRYSTDVIAVVDAQGFIRYATESIEGVFGYERDGLLGRQASELVAPDDLAAATSRIKELSASPDGPTRSPDGPTRFECLLAHADGQWRRAEVTAVNLLEDPDVRGMVLTVRDMTEQRALEGELAHQTFHDPLTGLANRALFTDRLSHSLERGDGPRLAVLFVDLDNFKGVNDLHGHEAGDQLLCIVAERIRGALRPADTAARVGGDEFAVLLDGTDCTVDAMGVAERVLDQVGVSVTVLGATAFTGVSIGVAIGREGTGTAETLLRDAAVAMQVAKRRGKHRVELYAPGMLEQALRPVEIEMELRTALERGELVLHHQPVVSLADSGAIVGVEALVRWAHPVRGLVPPSDFIPVAEDSGLIVPLGRWVLEEACRQGKAWHDSFPLREPLTMSVNLSPRQLVESRLIDEVADVLTRTGFPVSSLTLEVTESSLVDDIGGVRESLQALRDLGIRLALDDFGTGYSSLQYLRQLPVNQLKIDRSFIGRMTQSVEDAAVVRAILSLGRTLHLETLAEGIEESEQYAMLQELGCGLGQGYYFAKPLVPEALTTMLERSHRRHVLPARAQV